MGSCSPELAPVTIAELGTQVTDKHGEFRFEAVPEPHDVEVAARALSESFERESDGPGRVAVA